MGAVDLDAVKAAARGTSVRFTIVPTFTHVEAVQVETKKGSRWSKVGPMIFPPVDGDLSDVLAMLAHFRSEATDD